MAIIEATHLKYRYPGTDRLVLDDISCTIEKGEFVGILGANGAGKSTFCQAIAGLVPQFYKGAYGGKIEVCGLEAARTPVYEMCRKVGLVFQNPFNQLSGARDNVYEEVAFGMQNMGIPAEEMRTRTDEVLKQLDIYEYRDRNPFELSGGQMQRVAIASILVMKPEIIILDEPTSQLDPQGSEEVFAVVKELAKTGITILMVEQKMEKLAAYCNRILLMAEGKLIAVDTPQNIFSRNDLEECGVVAPVVTQFAKKNNLKNQDGTWPVTLAEVQQAVEKTGVQEKESDLCENVKADNRKLEELFSVQELFFHYEAEQKILQNLNVKFDTRATAVIGQNGAGKTTLVKLLKGLLRPVGGDIYYGGNSMNEKTVAMLAGQIGYVFQNPDDQIFKYSVLDEVMFGTQNIGMSREEGRAHALEALELMGIADKAHSNPYDLELSDRKMVAIASVLAMDTKVLILDEPTIAQDMRGKRRIRKMIQKLSEEGKSVIAILHDMDFVEETFERVLIMAKGEILADGTPEAVFQKEQELKKACLEKPAIYRLREALYGKA